MANIAELNLHDAVSNGDEAEVLSLLLHNPNVNVNWRHLNNSDRTALHYALWNGSDEIAQLLLAHPAISVNVKDRNGQTPFSLACENGRVSVVQLLLKDPRVNITLEDHWDRTPLWWAAREGNHEVIEWLIASSRGLGDIEETKGKGANGKFTALEIARESKKSEVVALLERFIANPRLTRHDLRAMLGSPDELAAALFAVIVFLCDDLLQLRLALVSTTATTATTRFFTIASKLPMELQMVLSHRAVGSMRQNILHRDSEAAFKSLAMVLRLLSQPE